jgi:site-specific recombinase XerD
MRGGWVERGTVLIRLSRPHFAFYRGYLEGLDVGPLASHYLETAAGVEDAAGDLRLAQSAVKWIRDQVLVLARRNLSASSARVLLLAREKLDVVYDGTLPTLEAFREERDPDEFYTEAEIILLYQEEYGNVSVRAKRQAARNARLRAKQIDALWQLEELVGVDPALDHGVDGWLDPAIAKRLIAANITTLQHLADAIQGLGFRWYARVPRIGIKAAAHIVRWLTEPSVSSALGVVLHRRALVRRADLGPKVAPTMAPRTDIVPLEYFIVPAGLDGATGSNRGERSLLSAHNDLAAINAWLSRCKPQSHTRRSYRKEAERFLLWSIMEKGKPISSLSVEDCIDYRDFLWNVGRMTPVDWSQRFKLPQDRWLGARGMQRWSPLWRPFEGMLSAGSQKTALVIVQALCQWLTEQHYLHGNPFKSVGRLAKRDGKIDVSRALTLAEWTAIKTYLASMPSDDRYYRLRFILVLAYSTGLRLSELASLKKRDLKTFARAGESEMQWELTVTGKGEVTREVQLNLFVANEIRHYFKRRGHASFAEAPADAPLIAALPAAEGKNPGAGEGESSQAADEPLGQSRLYDILKDFFGEVADSLESEEPEMAERIRRASTHWLRHTFATHALHSGVPLEVVRDLLGHKSLATTSVYVTTERDNRSREMEKFGMTVVL